MPGFRLKSVEFRRERQESWEELERILERASRIGLARLDADELHRLPTLYRAALSSLSVARAISLDRRLIAYLEGLATRAFIQVYGVKREFSKVFSYYLRWQFPALLFSHGRHLLLAIVSILLGLASGLALTLSDPEWFYSFVPSGLAGDRGPLSSRDELAQILTESSSEGLSSFASFLFSHNSKVGIMCFFLGMFAGVPGFLLLFSTGLMLGAFAAIHHQHGLDWLLWTWVLPHGVTELLAVCVCGAAGFAIGEAVVFPGRHSRLEEIARAGRSSGQLVLGAVAMFFVAALLEGFFRQLVTDPWTRTLVILLSSFFWLWYIVIHGRKAATQ